MPDILFAIGVWAMPIMLFLYFFRRDLIVFKKVKAAILGGTFLTFISFFVPNIFGNQIVKGITDLTVMLSFATTIAVLIVARRHNFSSKNQFRIIAAAMVVSILLGVASS